VQISKHIKSFAALMMVMMLSLSAAGPFGMVGTAAATSSVSGTVTDDDGNAVSNVTVEAVNDNGTVVASATSGTDGNYSLTGLSDNTGYTLQFSATGYQDASQSFSTGTGTSETVDISLVATTLTVDDSKTPTAVYVELGNANETTVTVEANVDGNWTTVNSTTVTPSETPYGVEINVSDYTNASEYRVSVSGQQATDTEILYEGGGIIGFSGSGGSTVLLAAAVAGGAYLLLRD
jgi:hypothetical protein